LSHDHSNRSWCEPLYEAQAAGLILYGRALGLGHGESEDVVHEVFAALLKLDHAPAQPDRYLVRAFRNRALNRHRSLWRRVAREFESHRWFERAADESPREREAMRCLRRLPPEQREVIVLKIWHQHTFEEIGELLDLSPHTAAGRYRYGLQKLRTCLRETTEDEAYESERSAADPTVFLDAAPPVPGA
jgi:RNA polymerase sigma-70 factor (ECF subfamily)